MPDNFKTDFQDFITLIKTSTNAAEVKKAYIQLVKKYHPDSVSPQLKSTYNDYMILINKVFSEGKSSVREVEFEEQPVAPKQSESQRSQSASAQAPYTLQGTPKHPPVFNSQKKVYTVTNYFGKTQQYTDFLEYVFHLGKEEFESGRMTMMYGKDYYGNFSQVASTSSYSKKDDIQNAFDAMQHFFNASKCFNYILKNHSEYIYSEYVKEELQKVTTLNNNLARTISNNSSKELAVKP